MDNKSGNQISLMEACSKKHNIKEVKKIFKGGANLLVLKNGSSALHFAARDADSEIIKYLINHNISVNIFNDNRDTPLMWACQAKGNIENVRILLAHGADINLIGRENNSALHFAAKCADSETIQYLINHNISVNIINNVKTTPLIWACQAKGNIENVRTLLAHGADINMTDKENNFALHFAARNADSETIQYLINHNISVNIMNDDNMTPLICSCFAKGNIENVRTLLAHGADINLTDKYNNSALHFAARDADSETIKHLINHNISVNIINNVKTTPLIWACFAKGNIENVRTLLAHGADINMTDKENNSALHFAARDADSETIKHLINHNISVNIMNDDKKTPLICACFAKGNIENVRTLLAHGADINMTGRENNSALHFAARDADSETIKHLINHNISVNKINEDKMTPLIWACQAKGNIENVRTLLAHGADINLTGKENNSALHFAAKCADSETIKYLINHNISVNIINNVKTTPLICACFAKGNIENVRTLLAHGADINLTNKYNNSALHFAAKCADSETIKYLINHNISVNIINNVKMTPLIWACFAKGNIENVRTLLAHGADINMTDKENNSALHFAAKCADSETIKHLINHNISVNIINDDKDTPLMWACFAKGNIENVRTLLAHAADINLTGKENNSALHFAARDADSETIKHLINHNISVNKINDDRDTPLMWACFAKGNIENVRTLLAHGADINMTGRENNSALHFAARDADSETIKYLINHNISVNIINDDSDTPLMWACQAKDNIENVRTLLTHGADINLTDKYNISALHFAARNADSETIECIISHSIPVGSVDDFNRTALFMACSTCNNLANVITLVSHGGDLNYVVSGSLESILDTSCGARSRENSKCETVDKLVKPNEACSKNLFDGFGMLHAAAKYSDGEMIEYLVSRGLSVNTVDVFGSTPLHLACEEDRLDNVRILVSLNGDVNLKTIEGWSLMHIAAARGSVDMIQYLFDIGLDVNLMDARHAAPLLWAQRADKHDNIALLNKLSSYEIVKMPDTYFFPISSNSDQLLHNNGTSGADILQYR